MELDNIIEVDIFTEDFVNVKGFQNSISWENSALEFVSVTNFGLPLFNNQNIGLQDTSNAMMSIAWIDPTDGFIELDSNFVICTILFQVLGEETGVYDVSFSDTPTPRQVVCLLIS